MSGGVSRFPEGYMHFLNSHQHQAKQALSTESVTQKDSSIGKKDARPSRPLYVAPGARTAGLSGTSIRFENNNTLPYKKFDDPTPACDTMQTMKSSSQPGLLTFSSDEEREVSVSVDDIDIEQFMSEAKPLILQALSKTESILPRVIEEVAGFIVNRAWQDDGYYNTAADLCVFICVKERHSQQNMFLPNYAFLRGLIVHTGQLVETWDEMRAANQEYWHAFVRFMIRLFRCLSERDFAVLMFASSIAQIAEALLSKLCLPNDIERELLIQLLKEDGVHLQKVKPELMDAIINRIRDIILEPHRDVKVMKTLIQAVEIYCRNCKECK